MLLRQAIIWKNYGYITNAYMRYSASMNESTNVVS